MSIAGADFDYLDLGRGTPVVFLHGALGDIRTFAPHCELLSQHFRAITYTQRYFGTKPWPKDGPAFGIETHSADLVALLEAFDIGPLHLVAWSYSGHAALRAAQLRPDLFRAMLIYETGFQTFMTDNAEIATFKVDLNEMFAPILAAASEGRLEDAARLVIDGSAGEAGYFDRQSQRSQLVEIENAHMLPLLLSQTPPPRITADDLKALEVPVTIACGECTRPAYKLISEAAIRSLPGQHHVIARVSHFWPDTEPEAFCGLVREWLISKVGGR